MQFLYNIYYLLFANIKYIRVIVLYVTCITFINNCCINIIQDLSKYTRGDIKQDNEVQIIQTIIGAGINREELRDEIFVQCMRQATNNPNIESTERVWLLICLAIVAFQPSKLLYKVTYHHYTRKKSSEHVSPLLYYSGSKLEK